MIGDNNLILRPYQIIGRDFLARRTRALLADEMRVGKTPQAILAADAIGAKRVLVVCQAIATHQWREEWATWSPNRAPAVIITDAPPPFDFEGVAIMSYNRAVQHLTPLAAVPKWDVFIPDEAHFAKNPEAQRTRAVYAKGGLGWNSRYIWPLTGTPAPNHAGEMWAMLRAFCVVKADYETFVRYFCYYDPIEGRVWGNKKQHLAELRALIRPIYLRRTRREVAPEMPRIGYNFMNVAPIKGVDLNTDDPGQVAETDRVKVALAKVPELVTEIGAQITSGELAQTVAFGYHVEPLQALHKLLSATGIYCHLITGATPNKQRQVILAEFKAGVCQVVIGQIIAAGTSIDLSAASHGYFLELDYVPGNNEQAANRLVSMQTQDAVTFDIVTWPGTMDDKVQRTLMRKVSGAVFKS